MVQDDGGQTQQAWMTAFESVCGPSVLGSRNSGVFPEGEYRDRLSVSKESIVVRFSVRPLASKPVETEPNSWFSTWVSIARP